MKTIWRFLKWPAYAVVIFFALTGALITYEWPSWGLTFLYDYGKGRFLKTEAFSEVNKKAIDFTIPDLNGNEISLSNFANDKPVLVVFWSFYCGPCCEEMSFLRKIYPECKNRGLEILAITGIKEKWVAEGYAKNENIPFPILYDPSKKTAKDYGVNGVPHAFFVNKEGIIKYTSIGFDETEEHKKRYKKFLDDFLADNK